MKKVLAIFILFLVLTISGCSVRNNNQEEIDNDKIKDKISDLQQEANKTPENEQQSKDVGNKYDLIYDDIHSLAECNFWKDKKFQEINTHNVKETVRDGAGSLVLKGKIVQRIENASFAENNEKVTKIYLVFDNPINDEQKIFYDYYLAIASNNGINSLDGQKLLFRLGAIKDSKFITTADISEELKNRIVSYIDKDDLVQLKLIIPMHPGSGAVDYFSFACDISE